LTPFHYIFISTVKIKKSIIFVEIEYLYNCCVAG
jgi:hypothetical protein